MTTHITFSSAFNVYNRTEPQITRKFILEEQKMCFLSWLFGGKGADEMTEEDELMLWMMLDEEEEDEK